MLKQKLIGVDQGPAYIFQPVSDVPSFGAVVQCRLQLDVGRQPADSGHVHVLNDILDRLTACDRLAKAIVFVAQLVMNGRTVEQFDRHCQI